MSYSPPFVKVLFLGRPSCRALKQKSPELKWFSGIFSGHVGIEFQPGRVVDFVSFGRFHWLPKDENPHSKFVIRSLREFKTLFGTEAQAPKMTVVTIPISDEQQKDLAAIIDTYTRQTPYDYAFLGMRCASATYDMLSRAGILPTRSRLWMIFRFFSPGLLKRYLDAK
ncbi:MAG: hypothetical protein ACOC2E_09315 [Bacteroidota bacterium]